MDPLSYPSNIHIRPHLCQISGGPDPRSPHSGSAHALFCLYWEMKGQWATFKSVLWSAAIKYYSFGDISAIYFQRKYIQSRYSVSRIWIRDLLITSYIYARHSAKLTIEIVKRTFIDKCILSLHYFNNIVSKELDHKELNLIESISNLLTLYTVWRVVHRYLGISTSRRAPTSRTGEVLLQANRYFFGTRLPFKNNFTFRTCFILTCIYFFLLCFSSFCINYFCHWFFFCCLFSYLIYFYNFLFSTYLLFLSYLEHRLHPNKHSEW